MSDLSLNNRLETSDREVVDSRREREEATVFRREFWGLLWRGRGGGVGFEPF